MGCYISLQVCTCEYVCKTDHMADTRTTPKVDLWVDSHQQAPISELGRRMEGSQRDVLHWAGNDDEL